MPRFAILEHDHPALHWDFLLENGDVLLTWRLSAPPAPGAAVNAARASDHRLLYLNYEGQVSGDRGAVTRWDGGMFEWVEREPNQLSILPSPLGGEGSGVRGEVSEAMPPHPNPTPPRGEGLPDQSLTVRLQGARLQGVFHLKWVDGESWRGWFTADPAGLDWENFIEVRR